MNLKFLSFNGFQLSFRLLKFYMLFSKQTCFEKLIWNFLSTSWPSYNGLFMFSTIWSRLRLFRSKSRKSLNTEKRKLYCLFSVEIRKLKLKSEIFITRVISSCVFLLNLKFIDSHSPFLFQVIVLPIVLILCVVSFNNTHKKFVVWVLWHINNYGLFNAKSSLLYNTPERNVVNLTIKMRTIVRIT